MNEEVLNILNVNKEESTFMLCDKYNIMPFQAELIYNIIFQFNHKIKNDNNSEYYIKKCNEIINRLNNGYFLNEEIIENMVRGYVKGHLKNEKEASVFLEEMGMNASRVTTFLEEYYTACRYEDQMLSEELDVHALNVQINSLLEEAGLLIIQKQSRNKSL